MKHLPSLIAGACALMALAATGSALAAPAVTRLTPPSERFSSGRPEPVIARFLPGQRFDLQATIKPDAGQRITAARFLLDGKPVDATVAMRDCASGCVKGVSPETAIATVREEDGLAMSSRNVYLEPADRARAVALSHALAAAEQQALARDSLEAGLAAARIELAAAAIEPEYLEARDAETLEPVEGLAGRPILVAVAAQVGGARLIDNVVIEPLAG